MYNDYFKLSCLPFENTLDQRFLFMSECHEEVIAALLYFVREKKSFAMVCGDVGTGKTMIVHHLLGRLPASVQPIVIPYPDVEHIEILRYIARALRIDTEGKGVLQLSDDLKEELSKASTDSRQVVLIIDEAHLLPVASLENIRLLSNIELSGSKLLQILLIGQKELAVKLQKPELRQLRQRININRALSPMDQSETRSYIDHRLKTAGSSFDACFERGCRKTIHGITGGVPRSINRLCDTALLICMTHKSEKVTSKILKKAQAALDSDSIVSPEAHLPGPRSHFKKLWPAFAAALVLLFAVSFFGYSRHSARHTKTSPPHFAAKNEVAEPIPKRQVTAPAAKVHERPASKVEANHAPATLPAPVEKPVPTALHPRKVRATGNVVKSAEAAKKISLPASESGPVPPAAKGMAALRGIQDEDSQMAKPARVRPNFIIIKAKRGDYLTRIAEKWFPEDPKSGLKSIVAANPEIHNVDLIFIDQTLKIPIREKDQKTGDLRH